MKVYLCTALDDSHFEITPLFDTPSDKRYEYNTSDECLSICDWGYDPLEYCCEG